jgi:8-oxo-dGTP pyrophosphatase MutT (NUDIX family)
MHASTQGGVVGAGESYEDNAAREVEEEMGVVGAPLSPLFDFFFEDAVTRVWGRTFRATHDGPLTLQASEVAGGEWMSLADAAARARDGPCCPDSAAALAEYVRRMDAGELAPPPRSGA